MSRAGTYGFTRKAVEGKIGVPVTTLAVLDALPVDNENRIDGVITMVRADSSLWVFDLDSTAAASDAVRVPSAGSGRFLRLSQGAQAGSEFFVRGATTANIANLAAFTVAGNDGLTYTEGQRVLLPEQTTKAENGIYVVGAVGGGTAPLTRAPDMPTGDAVPGGTIVHVNEGTLYAQSDWKLTTAGGIVAVGTTAHDWYPGRITQSLSLVAGTTTITNVPVLSVTKTGWAIVRRVANTSTATTGGYGPSLGGANGVTAGRIGTASVVIEACVAAGTINNADISTLEITVINW